MARLVCQLSIVNNIAERSQSQRDGIHTFFTTAVLW